jgi:uncharacterized membrane protein YgaE (UPF0421/DUF939 family)
MPIQVTPIRRILDRLRTKDPRRDALRRAIRAAVTVPLAGLLSLVVVGGTSVPLFTLGGAFWLLVVADFPGNREQRLVGYLGVAVAGSVLTVVGTLVAPAAWWVAVTSVFVLGVGVTLAGVTSATISAAQRVILLTYLWPVCMPVGPIGERLLGWLIAVVICVPASLFFLPPRYHDDLRRHAADVCAALADRIEGIGSDVTAAMDTLRTTFLAASFRPVGLSAGSRALLRVIDNLGLASDLVDQYPGTTLGPAKRPTIDVLRCCARLLDVSQVADRAIHRAALDQALPQLRSLARGRYREDVARILEASDDTAAVAVGRRQLWCRVLVIIIGLSGRVIAAGAAADARPVWARALGLRLPRTGFADRLLPEAVAATKMSTGSLATNSVAAHNSLRTGVGLALAVAITHLLPVQHGFWVALGTISVLGSSALSTRSNVVHAVVGTVLGITVGGALLAAIGLQPVVLWPLLPIAVFGSAYLPRFFSFATAQGMVALTVLIIVNLTASTGWRMGLLRIEDIAMGAGVGMVVSLLLWPTGAAAAVSAVIEAAVDAGVPYLRAAVWRVTRDSTKETEAALRDLSSEALIRSWTVDDAVRQYLSETASGADHRTPVVMAANRTVWLRVAAEIIADIPTLPPPSAYPSARALLEARTESLCDRLTGGSDRWHLLAPEFVRAVRSEVTDDGDPVEAAQPLVTVAANLAMLGVVLTSGSDSAAALDRSLAR